MKLHPNRFQLHYCSSYIKDKSSKPTDSLVILFGERIAKVLEKHS
jgi:hypothetical protein